MKKTAMIAALIALGGVCVHAASVSTNGLILVDATQPEDYNSSMINITGTPGNNGVAVAFDNDFSLAGSRWLVKAQSCWAAYEFETPTVINGYGVWNGDSEYNPAERAPRDFGFYGSNDGVTWTVLDTQTGETGWSRAEMRFYRFGNATAYKHYKFGASGFCV